MTLDAQAIELIGLLEAATEGSGELNVAIWRAVDPKQAQKIADALAEAGYPGNERLLANNCEDYTGSLDAALTLVPENFRWVLASHSRDGLPVASVYYVRPGDLPVTKFEPGVLRQSSHPVPALALCIAALKARAALHPQPDTTSEVM